MKKGVSVDSLGNPADDPKAGSRLHQRVRFTALQTDFTDFSENVRAEENRAPLRVVEIYNHEEEQRRKMEAEEQKRSFVPSSFIPLWDVKQSGSFEVPRETVSCTLVDEFELKQDKGNLLVYRKR